MAGSLSGTYTAQANTDKILTLTLATADAILFGSYNLRNLHPLDPTTFTCSLYGAVDRRVGGNVTGSITSPLLGSESAIPITGSAPQPGPAPLPSGAGESMWPFFIPSLFEKPGAAHAPYADGGPQYGSVVINKTASTPLAIGDGLKAGDAATALSANLCGYRYLKLAGDGSGQIQFTVPTGIATFASPVYDVAFVNGEATIDLCQPSGSTNHLGLNLNFPDPSTVTAVKFTGSGTVTQILPVVKYGSELVYFSEAFGSLQVLCDGHAVWEKYCQFLPGPLVTNPLEWATVEDQINQGDPALTDTGYTATFTPAPGWLNEDGTPASSYMRDVAAFVSDGVFPGFSATARLWGGPAAGQTDTAAGSQSPAYPVRSLNVMFTYNPVVGPLVCRFRHGQGVQGLAWGANKPVSAQVLPPSIQTQNADGSWSVIPIEPVQTALPSGVPGFYRLAGLPFLCALRYANVFDARGKGQYRLVTQIANAEWSFPWFDFNIITQGGSDMALSRATGVLWAVWADANGNLQATGYPGWAMGSPAAAGAAATTLSLGRAGLLPAILLREDTASYELLYVNPSEQVVRAISTDQFNTLGDEMQVFAQSGSSPSSYLEASSGITYYYQVVANGDNEDVWGKRLAGDGSTWLPWSDGSIEKPLTGLVGLAPAGRVSVVRNLFAPNLPLQLLHGETVYASAGGSGAPAGEVWES